MTPAELVSAVRARLDETERRAEALRSYPGRRWVYVSGDYGPQVRTGNGVWSLDCRAEVWRCDDEADGCPDEAREWAAEGCWIALHDPAAVLRRVAADRRVLQRHKPVDARVVLTDHVERQICDYCSDAAEHPIANATEWLLDTDEQAVKWPCPDFADLADRLGIDTEETPQ